MSFEKCCVLVSAYLLSMFLIYVSVCLCYECMHVGSSSSSSSSSNIYLLKKNNFINCSDMRDNNSKYMGISVWYMCVWSVSISNCEWVSE